MMGIGVSPMGVTTMGSWETPPPGAGLLHPIMWMPVVTASGKTSSHAVENGVELRPKECSEPHAIPERFDPEGIAGTSH